MQKLSRLVLALGLCLAPLSLRAEDTGPETVVATVNGTEITLGHMIMLYASLPPEYQGMDPTALYSGILDQLIKQTALQQNLGEPTLAARLRIDNDTRATLASEAVTKIADAAVSDEIIAKAYEERYANAAPGKEFHAAHILVKTKEEIDAVIVRLNAGEDFATVAKETSLDTTAQNGGDLGWFGLGVMVKPFEDAVVALKKDAISPPVESQFGWHVIKLLDERLLETPSLDQVKDQLTDDLRREAVESEMERLVAEGEVTQIEAGKIDPAILSQIDLVMGKP